MDVCRWMFAQPLPIKLVRWNADHHTKCFTSTQVARRNNFGRTGRGQSQATALLEVVDNVHRVELYMVHVPPSPLTTHPPPPRKGHRMLPTVPAPVPTGDVGLHDRETADGTGDGMLVALAGFRKKIVASSSDSESNGVVADVSDGVSDRGVSGNGVDGAEDGASEGVLRMGA